MGAPHRRSPAGTRLEQVLAIDRCGNGLAAELTLETVTVAVGIAGHARIDARRFPCSFENKIGSPIDT